MKRTVVVALAFVLLASALGVYGEHAVKTTREILPASWTVAGPVTRSVSVDKYGAGGFVRGVLFGSPARRNVFLAALAAISLLFVYCAGILTSGSGLRSDPQWAWTDVLWVVMGIAVFETVSPPGETVSSGMLCVRDTAAGVWIWILAWRRRIGVDDLGFNLRRLPPDVSRGVLSAILILPGLLLLVLAAAVREGPSSVPNIISLGVSRHRVDAILSILIIPFFEEVIFRAFLYRLLRARMPAFLANLVVSLLFAAAHWPMGGVVTAGRFAGSLLMGRLYERTGTVWSSLGAHAAFNAILLMGPNLW